MLLLQLQLPLALLLLLQLQLRLLLLEKDCLLSIRRPQATALARAFRRANAVARDIASDVTHSDAVIADTSCK